MSVRFTLLAALLVASSSASAKYSDSVDKDGCWDARTDRETKCIKQTDHAWKDGTIFVTYRNACANRLYAKTCHRKNNGKSDCTSFAIEPRSNYQIYTLNATGDINYNAVGATKPGFGAMCARRFNMRVKG